MKGVSKEAHQFLLPSARRGESSLCRSKLWDLTVVLFDGTDRDWNVCKEQEMGITWLMVGSKADDRRREKDEMLVMPNRAGEFRVWLNQEISGL